MLANFSMIIRCPAISFAHVSTVAFDQNRSSSLWLWKGLKLVYVSFKGFLLNELIFNLRNRVHWYLMSLSVNVLNGWVIWVFVRYEELLIKN
jgi:hypothetical protein